MANYTNTLKPIPDLWIENNIADLNELKTWIEAIVDGRHIGLKYYQDSYGVFFRLDIIDDSEPAIQDYVTFAKSPRIFQRYLADYIQNYYGIVKSTKE